MSEELGQREHGAGDLPAGDPLYIELKLRNELLQLIAVADRELLMDFASYLLRHNPGLGASQWTDVRRG